MHAFLIAVVAWDIFGIAAMLKYGGPITAASLVANGVKVALCLWAFALLVMGH